MGYVLAFGKCWGCQRIFGFNPHRVPRTTLGDVMCEDCMRRVNREREKKGQAPLPVHPDAYEPTEANEPPPGAIDLSPERRPV